MLGQGRQGALHIRVSELAGPVRQRSRRLVHLLPGVGDDLVRLLRQEVPLPHVPRQCLLSAGVMIRRATAEVRLHPVPEPRERPHRSVEGRLEPGSSHALPAQQPRQSPPEERQGAAALTDRPLRPFPGGVPDVLPGGRQQRGHRLQPGLGRRDAFRQRSEVRKEEGHEPEDRLAGVHAGVAPPEMQGPVLPALDPEKPPGQSEIQQLRISRPVRGEPVGLHEEGLHVGQSVPGAVFGKVGKPVVEVVPTDERTVDRPVRVVGREEPVEPIGQGRRVGGHGQ
jgi:hypothetical protein